MLKCGMPPVSLCPKSHSFKKLGSDSPTSSLGLRLSAWEEELKGDIDRKFILNGIKNGFDIIDIAAEPKPVQCDNHKSA